MADAWFSPDAERLFALLSLLAFLAFQERFAKRGEHQALVLGCHYAGCALGVFLLLLAAIGFPAGQPQHVISTPRSCRHGHLRRVRPDRPPGSRALSGRRTSQEHRPRLVMLPGLAVSPRLQRVRHRTGRLALRSKDGEQMTIRVNKIRRPTDPR